MNNIYIFCFINVYIYYILNTQNFLALDSNVDKKTFAEKNLWDKITPEKLTAQSSEILRYRYAMLFYLDRLDIYKVFLIPYHNLYT